MTDPGSTRRSPLPVVLAVALTLAGGIWILQGLGVLTAGRSFMVGDPRWALIGAILVVVGLALARRSRR